MDPRTASVAVGAPDLSTVGPPVYANVTHVSFTEYDFRLTFSLLSTPHEGEGGAPDVVALAPHAVAEIVVPAAAVGLLVDVLRAELDRYTEEFGSPQPTR